MKILRSVYEFEWDKGNKGENVHKHAVSDDECEEVFFDPKKKILRDALHSDREKRFIILGKTKSGRLLFVVFAIRKNRIRVISARTINKREIHLYE